MKLTKTNPENINYGEKYGARSKQRFVPWNSDKKRWRLTAGRS